MKQSAQLLKKLEGFVAEHDRMAAEKERQNDLIRAQQRRENDESLLRLLAQLDEAERRAIFICRDKVQCDKVFSLTQIYIDSIADMKIQIATDAILETHNPTEDGKIGLKAWRIPGRGTAAEIKINVSCYNQKYNLESCGRRKIDAYNGFVRFIKDRLL